ncbi:hypothetical protein JZ751_025047 [Albula glossodonta]|uniref:RGS domain-containing protein n=1 Tax=Albula glossodonta TaxID=121402 RepID=A0A8T2PMS2_9TELE|nr:hypothetical protein JZ751_025047 [Albula glossodonta]
MYKKWLDNPADMQTQSHKQLKPEDMQLWSQSLEKLLESKYGMRIFQAFLKSEFSDENIEFWLICEDYKKIQSSFRMNCEAKRIYEMYIQAEAPKEINIDQQTRELIRGNLTAPTKLCFEDAQRVVYTLMERDSYPRFLKLTADDVTEWAQSFEKLLSHKYGKAAFQVFLKSEFCEENMEFWLACEEFRNIQSPTKLSLRATSIYEEFIKSESPKEVNLDFYTKDAIIQNIQLPTHFCFVAAQKKIYNLMENSSYPRFIDSHIYRELHAATQREGKHFRT